MGISPDVSLCIERPDLAFGNLGKISTGLLTILDPLLENKKIPLESKDYDNIKDIKKFLSYSVIGMRNWEKMPKNLFNYDSSFFVNPNFAAKVGLEVIGYYIGYVMDLKEARNKLSSYSAVLDKFQNQEEINKKDLKETIKFLDGLGKMSEEEVQEAIFGVKPLRKTLLPRPLWDYIRPQPS